MRLVELIRGRFARSQPQEPQEPQPQGAEFTTWRDGERVTIEDAEASIQAVCADVAGDYTAGALPWALDVAAFRSVLRDAENRLDLLAATPGGPLRADWLPAVAALRAILREIVTRYRQHVAAGDRRSRRVA